MGSGRWDPSDWTTYTTSKSYDTKTTSGPTGIYSSSALDSELDPKGVKLRESRDSADNPNSTPLIVALDVTGSMGAVLDQMARKGLNTLCTEVYERKPISDPHVMCMAVGDVRMGDRAPLQVTQFEADIRIAKQLEKIFLEGGGGGNKFESYGLPWYFAANHTASDSFDKRGKKGYLFTIGDEWPMPDLTAEEIQTVLGENPERAFTAEELLTMASKQWEVFHVVVQDASYHDQLPAWQKLMGQRALALPDHTKMAELIVSTIQAMEGANKDTVAKSWKDSKTTALVKTAIGGLTPTGSSGGLVNL